MADNSKIKIDELSFEGIKTNLKTFMKGQTTFKDYDFEGSALAVLIDILAYNTHYNAIYTNLAINEMFLDSASKRDSVVSICKMLGYTPRSARSSKASVNVTVKNYTSSTNTLTLPAKSVFTTTNAEGTNLYFSNKDSVIVPLNNGYYSFSDLEIYEGIYYTQKYIVGPGVRYVIPNIPCDTSSIEVYVSDSVSSADTTLFTLADYSIAASGSSAIYWLKEIEETKYELEFGDGAIGKQLATGNLVRIVYRTTSADNSNGCKTFKLDPGLYSGASIAVSTTSVAMGGADAETLESIKFNAPRAFSTQNRAVTENDFKNLVFQGFTNVKSINVWGGEENNPPQYGKVYLSIQPKTSDYLTDLEKTYIKNEILKPKAIVTSTVEIVDPIYLNIILSTTAYYNSKATSNSSSVIAGLITNTIVNYNNELMKFDSVFRQSKISRLIDASDKSIQNNITKVTLSKELTPKYNVNAQYYIDVGNPLYYSGVPEEVVQSSGFYTSEYPDKVCYFKDDGVGNIFLYYTDSGKEVIVNSTLGTVAYSTGIINISKLNIIAIDSDNFMIYMKPESYDVAAVRNQIIRILIDEMSVNVLVDPISSGNARGGNAYKFTSSRS